MNHQKNGNYVLSLYSKTWIRDSHGLFDYESQQTRNLSTVFSNPTIIIRQKNEIKQKSQISEFSLDEEFLFEIRNDNKEEYSLINNVPINAEPTEQNINEISNKIWYIVKFDPNYYTQNNQTIINSNDDYFLCANDVIKLGRVKYSLSEINIPSHQNKIDFARPPDDKTKYDIDNLNINTPPVFNFLYEAKDSNDFIDIPQDEKICKICYDGLNEENNPLVHLCKCNGGLRFSHFECIKKWMQMKLVIKQNEKGSVFSYNIKSFNCEICKTPYPFKFIINRTKKIFELIDLQKPQNCNYIILESLNQMKDNCNIKSIHIIKLENDVILGRGHESDVRINDISVSRAHAKLSYNAEDGTLLIRDLKSKFGTLILIKKPLVIKQKKIHLQIGRTYFEAWLMNMAEYEKWKKEKKIKKEKKLQLKSKQQYLNEFALNKTEGSKNDNNNNNEDSKDNNGKNVNHNSDN